MNKKNFTVDLLQAAIVIKNFLEQEKNSGITHAYYTWDATINAPVAFDTEEIFHLNVANYALRGVHFTHTIEVDSTTTTRMNVSKMTIHVFRDEDLNAVLTNYINAHGEFITDVFAMALGFFPADCQATIIEVTF
jgi:hypothetical protein